MDTNQRTILENIMGRLPYKQFEDNRKALSHLLEDPSDLDMTDFANLPVIVDANDAQENKYLGFMVNKNDDGISYRSPYSKNYSSDNQVERMLNEILKKYMKSYFDDGHSNFYITNRSESERVLEGIFVVRKDSGEKKKMLEGRWLTYYSIRMTWEADKKSGQVSIVCWKDVQVSAASKNFGRFDFNVKRRVRREDIKFSEHYKYMTNEEFEVKHVGQAFENEENMTYNNVVECDFGTTENVLNKSRKLEHNNEFYTQKIVLLGEALS